MTDDNTATTQPEEGDDGVVLALYETSDGPKFAVENRKGGYVVRNFLDPKCFDALLSAGWRLRATTRRAGGEHAECPPLMRTYTDGTRFSLVIVDTKDHLVEFSICDSHAEAFLRLFEADLWAARVVNTLADNGDLDNPGTTLAKLTNAAGGSVMSSMSDLVRLAGADAPRARPGRGPEERPGYL